MEFQDQVTDVELIIDNKPRVYLKWRNMEEGRDRTACYERITIGTSVVYENVNNRESSVLHGDPFWAKLEGMYNKAKNFNPLILK